MAARLVAAEEAEERQRLLDEAAAQDERQMRARMAEHAEHVDVANTGMTAAELRELQQATVDARDVAGWDPTAPPGTAAHPEVLVDGASLTPTVHAPAVPAAAATRSVPEYLDTIEGQLARAQAEADAWNAPQIRRVRQAATAALEIRRGSARPPVVRVPRELSRSVTARPSGYRKSAAALARCPDPRCEC